MLQVANHLQTRLRRSTRERSRSQQLSSTALSSRLRAAAAGHRHLERHHLSTRPNTHSTCTHRPSDIQSCCIATTSCRDHLHQCPSRETQCALRSPRSLGCPWRPQEPSLLRTCEGTHKPPTTRTSYEQKKGIYDITNTKRTCGIQDQTIICYAYTLHMHQLTGSERVFLQQSSFTKDLRRRWTFLD